MTIPVAAAVILACAILNRLAGDARWMGKPAEGDGKGWLPGRPVFYVAPAIAAVALCVWPWWASLAFGGAFLFWRSFSWGHLFGLGRFAPLDRPMPPLERTLLRLGGGNVYAALTLRHAFMLPLAIAQPWALAFPPLATAAYEVGGRFFPRWPILVAEVLTGAIIGVLIVWR